MSNTGTTPVRLLVYPVDGLTGQTSGVVYANRGQADRETGRWLTVRTTEVTLGPHTQTTVGFSVRVPPLAVPGDHLAGIAFQNAAETSGPVDPRASFRIVEIFREVVGVLVRVPGPGRPELQLGSSTLTAPSGGSPGSVIIRITNAGRRLCKPRLRLALTGQNGTQREIGRQLDTILPGDSIGYPLALFPGLDRGSYRVRAQAACGADTATRVSTVRLGNGSPGPGAGYDPNAGPGQGELSWLLPALVAGTAIFLTVLIAVATSARTRYPRLARR